MVFAVCLMRGLCCAGAVLENRECPKCLRHRGCFHSQAFGEDRASIHWSLCCLGNVCTIIAIEMMTVVISGRQRLPAQTTSMPRASAIGSRPSRWCKRMSSRSNSAVHRQRRCRCADVIVLRAPLGLPNPNMPFVHGQKYSKLFGGHLTPSVRR